MPGFFDPVTATFVRSILEQHLGYTLLDIQSTETVLVNGLGATARTTINAATGLAKIPRAVLIELENVCRVAGGALTAVRATELRVYETGGALKTNARSESPTGAPTGYDTRCTRLAVLHCDASGQIDWEGTADAEVSIVASIRRLGAMY